MRQCVLARDRLDHTGPTFNPTISRGVASKQLRGPSHFYHTGPCSRTQHASKQREVGLSNAAKPFSSENNHRVGARRLSIRRTGYRPGERGDVTAYLKCMAGVRPHNPHRCSSARSVHSVDESKSRMMSVTVPNVKFLQTWGGPGGASSRLASDSYISARAKAAPCR